MHLRGRLHANRAAFAFFLVFCLMRIEARSELNHA